MSGKARVRRPPQRGRLSLLVPRSERDPKFREYLNRLSYPGLQTLALVEIAAPLLLEFGRMAVGGGNDVAARILWQTASMMIAGSITFALSALKCSRRHPRRVAVFSAWMAPALLLSVSLLAHIGPVGTDDYILAAITVVVLTAVTTIPFLPWHMLALGGAIETVYILAGRWENSLDPAHSEAHHVFLVLLTLLATGIAAFNHEQRRAEFEAAEESVRVAEALTGAQLRAQLAENAISVGKMAAALSHEINSPMGTLRSSIQTLLALTERQADAPPVKREILCEMRSELCRSITESAARIDDVMERLRRFVNLEDAEMKSADLNELISGVTLLQDQRVRERGIRLEMDLEAALPPLTCRPQLLSAVFTTLLGNAIDAVNGDGRISIRTRGQGREVEITIRDNGRGMSPAEAETVFEPSFKVEGGRVSSGHWGLFNSRQIVYEHGGEISVETAEGRGTSVRVSLPL